MSSKVAIVTGANKGIGFAIVRGLCKRFDGVVYLTSRDVQRGKSAVEELEKEGLKPKFHQLDVTDKQSLEVFRDYVKKNYDGIDILVNNAAIAFKGSAPEPVAVQAEQTLFVNYFSLVSTCEFLFPLLKSGARVVNLSSSMGHLSNIPSKELQKKFTDPNLTVTALSELMQSYIDAAKKGTHAAEWGNSSYSVSKVGVTALTIIQQRNLADKVNTIKSNTETAKVPRRKQIIKPWITSELLKCVRNRDNLHKKLRKDPENEILKTTYKKYRNNCNHLLKKAKRTYEETVIDDAGNDIKNISGQKTTLDHSSCLLTPDIKVNAVHPGYVSTDMSSFKGPLTIDKGAEAPLYLALDAPDTVKGQYVWHNKDIVSWVDTPPSIY